MEAAKDIMTLEQVADYLQFSKDTIYGPIREGRLAASRLGRSYRITKDSVDLLFLATSTGRIAREVLSIRLGKVAESNMCITSAEVERDVAEAIAEIRRKYI